MAFGVKVKNKFDEVLFSDEAHLGMKRLLTGYTNVQFFQSENNSMGNAHKIPLPGGANKTNTLVFARPEINVEAIYDHPKYASLIPWMQDENAIKHAAALRGFWPMAVTYNDDDTISIIGPDAAVNYYDGINQSTNQPQFDTIRPLNNSAQMYSPFMGVNGQPACKAYYEVWVSGIDPDYNPNFSSFNLNIGTNRTLTSESYLGAIFIHFSPQVGTIRRYIGVPTHQNVKYRGFRADSQSSAYDLTLFSVNGQNINAISPDPAGRQETDTSGPFFTGLITGEDVDELFRYVPDGTVGLAHVGNWSRINFSGSGNYGSVTNFSTSLGVQKTIRDCWWCEPGKEDIAADQFGVFVFSLEGDVGNSDVIFNSLFVNDTNLFLRENARYFVHNTNSTWVWEISQTQFDSLPASGTVNVKANNEGFVDFSTITEEESGPTDTIGLQVKKPGLVNQELEVFDSTSEFFRIEQTGYNNLGLRGAINRQKSYQTPFIDKNYIVPFRMYLEQRSNSAQLDYMACLNGGASAVAIINGGIFSSGNNFEFQSSITGDPVTNEDILAQDLKGIRYPNTDNAYEITGGTDAAHKNRTGYWRAFVEFHYQDEEDIYYKVPQILQVPRLAYTKYPFQQGTEAQLTYETKFQEYVRFNPQVGVKTLSMIGKTV
jgi:hypothetical protein